MAQYSWACSGAQSVGNQSTEESGNVVPHTEPLLGPQHGAMPFTPFLFHHYNLQGGKHYPHFSEEETESQTSYFPEAKQWRDGIQI